MWDGHLEGSCCLGVWEERAVLSHCRGECKMLCCQQLLPGLGAESAPPSTHRAAVITDIHAWQSSPEPALFPRPEQKLLLLQHPQWGSCHAGTRCCRAGLIATCPKPAPRATRGVRTRRPHNGNSKQPNPISSGAAGVNEIVCWLLFPSPNLSGALWSPPWQHWL